ncbi:MAG: HAMP domain-containing histidine kinase [Phycisphaeraceae bacterium]|nr:HAMP domain-containing histidine kinase [Phycisphaeraceae bacterium]
MYDYFALAMHELKNPVVGIAGLLNILKNDLANRLDERSRENVDLCVQECARLQRILHQLQSLHHIQQMDPGYRQTSLHELIDRVVNTVQPRMQDTQVRIVVTGCDVKAEFPAALLAEALSRLIDNALRHGGGDVTIHTSSRDHHMVIRVTDHGPGIDPRYQQRIFEPLRRYPHQSAQPDTCIGLASVGILMARINGRVDVQSQPGQGATFCLEFPLKPPNRNLITRPLPLSFRSTV